MKISLSLKQKKISKMMSQQHVEKNVQKYLNENCIRLNPSEKKLQDQINREIVSTQNQCCTADCGQLMRVLIRGTNAARCLEIGCGMTTLSMAMAMQNEGKLVTINNLERTVTPQMKNIWKEAGVDTKVNFYVKNFTIHLKVDQLINLNK